MKKIFYLIAAIGITWGVVSCDNEPKNPGDFNVKANLTFSDLVSTTTGETYKFNVARSIDSIYKYKVALYDSIFDENGKFVQRQVKDSVYIPASFTTKFIEMEPVILPSYADTFYLELQTNARWIATEPDGTLWLYNESTTTGGGDGFISLRSARNRNGTRKNYSNMYVYTSDSTVMYKIPFGQIGERDEN